MRRIWESLPEAARAAVIASERFAHDSSAWAELECARQTAESAIGSASTWGRKNALRAATWCASLKVDILGIARSVAWGAAYAVGDPETPEGAKRLAVERLAQADLLRQAFSGPQAPA